MDKKYKILLLLLLGLVILYLIWRIFLRRNNPKGNSSLGDVFFGLEKYETPKEYQILHNLAKNSIPEPLDLGIKEYKRQPVPKKLYRTWCTSYPEGICGGRKTDIDALNSTLKAIPDWEQIIYGDKEIDNFLEKEFGKDHKVTKAYNLINPKYGAAKADLFRYLIIYKYGGLYLDMKSCVSGPIPEMPKDKDMWISEWNGQGAHQHLFPETGEYQNWYIYARKGCPLLKEIIERVVHNIYKLHKNPNNIINISESLFKNNRGLETKSKGNVLCTTGPIAMTIAILNSNQINNVQVDTSINYVLDYYCIKDDWLGTKDHYSQQTEPLIFPKKDTNHIPKVVYMTYHDIDSVPQYVFDNINKYCSGYEVKIYNHNMCLEFLEKYYGKEAVEIFNNMEIGAHKADFWKYCILYVFGGYYFDIKTDFQTHINNIFDSKKEKTWYTVKAGDAIFNGIIVTPPHNPVILDAIKHIYNNPKPTNYHTYVKELLNIVTKNCRNKVKVGENEQKNGWQCILLQENCDNNCGNNCDRYGLNCIIVDKEGKKVFNTRYKDFGSWGKQKVENYVHSQKTYISMTTIPERLKDDWFLNNLKRTIGLLENNQILIINIPKVSLKGEQYIIPDVMNAIQGKNFIINHCEKDEGPISKLLPSLRNKEIKDDDIIIVCDDDIVYREDIFKLLEKSVLDTKNSFASMCTPGPEGFKGFAFIKKTLKPLLNVKIPESCQRIDDDVIKWYMNKNNMHNIVVSYKGNNDWNCSMYKEETDTHPKWSELLTDDREPMIKKCLKDLNNIKEDYSPSRAQFGQDLWALEHHNQKRNGTYLEIGVHDGENANNTVMMDQEYGWSGVCIDPMMKNMEKRSCKQFKVALGSETGEADFRYSDGGDQGLSGLDKFANSDNNKQWKDVVSNFKMKKVQVRTPEDVFTEANLPSTIDYMSLDVEGAEMDILRSFPFDKYCVKYATIETNNDKEKEKEMEEFMTQRGYKFEGHKEVDHIFSNSC